MLVKIKYCLSSKREYMFCSYNCDSTVFISKDKRYYCIRCHRKFDNIKFADQEEQLTNDKEILEFIDKLYGTY